MQIPAKGGSPPPLIAKHTPCLALNMERTNTYTLGDLGGGAVLLKARTHSQINTPDATLAGTASPDCFKTARGGVGHEGSMGRHIWQSHGVSGYWMGHRCWPSSISMLSGLCLWLRRHLIHNWHPLWEPYGSRHPSQQSHQK